MIRLGLNNEVLEGEKLAFEVQHVALERAHQNGEGFLIERRRIGGLDPITLMLDQCAATADAEQETALAEMVQHADFFIDAQRVIERQYVNQRSQLDFMRALDRGAKKHAR